MIRYRLRFVDRPDLSNDDFESGRVYRAGDTLELRDGLERATDAWAITAVVPGREGLPDTLVCDLVSRQAVTVSAGAAAFATERGGRIYIWGDPLGATAAWLRASTDDPGGGRRYEARKVGDVEVFVATDVTPLELKVRLSLSRGRLVAEWPAGGAVGASGGVF